MNFFLILSILLVHSTQAKVCKVNELSPVSGLKMFNPHSQTYPYLLLIITKPNKSPLYHMTMGEHVLRLLH